MKYVRLMVVVLVSAFLVACTAVPDGIAPVKGFDKNKYLGTWYEIARLDHSFERGLEQVSATYSVRDDGGIDVLNKGFNPEKQAWKEAKGKAYFVGDEQTGHLKVSFFGPFYASYVIAALDKQGYQHALVTGPDTSYLWVLSRNKQMAQADLDALLAVASSAGFDTQALIFVEQQ